MAFLPVERKDGEIFDFILVSTDAYVDHPSFGHAIISRLVESEGFLVGIIPQPKTDAEYTALGAPKEGFLVSGGVVDSMVNNYTVARRRRDSDSYSEGGRVGRTPDRAVTVHTKNLKRLFPNVPVLIGGIEASLRRFAHYDYWADKVMPSILFDCRADLLVYGMGEVPLLEILALIKRGARLEKIKDVRGTAYISDFEKLSKKVKSEMENGEAVMLPSFERTASDKLAFIEAFNVEYRNSTFNGSKRLVQPHNIEFVVINPPARPPSTAELDRVYALPFERNFHPRYRDGVPALSEVKFSLTSHRGCFGACNYCAVTLHQGAAIIKRSKESLIAEAEKLKALPDFKGYIHDVGGPTANFRDARCSVRGEAGSCSGKSCIGSSVCPNLVADHSEYLDILRALRKLEGVKKVFIRSGIRFDYLLMDSDFKSVLAELVEHHISGQLKVAPEHSSARVLKLMNKPPFEVYLKFAEQYKKTNKARGIEQYLVPYLISSHPGCTVNDAIDLARYLKSIGYMPLQVQDFYPTPGTKSTAMYWTGIDPDTMEEIYVARSGAEKSTQRALLQYRLDKNRGIIKDALIEAGRLNLMGEGPNCLIKSDKVLREKSKKRQNPPKAKK
ncbi:MAG TPA: YgiQ family radical SAM protein [Eubacteriales bacterium]|nr:YgiQ family radical SAM protein [Clostridia bacterium]HRR89257.1 YgiQ family radical SAM protein [Eubacteriales bacterium]HRU83897.1 YgiQ family radical SAM protein [Eubacteriales bacterium]